MQKVEDAASLEDLLRLQEQFQARSEAPAAKVTFVGGARRQAEGASKGDIPVSDAAQAHRDTSTGEVEKQEHEAAEKSVLVGDVMERVVGTTQPPSVPTHPPAGGGFPLAKHRRQSRFALSRKAKQNADAPTEAAASQGEATVNAANTAVSGAETDIDAENRAALQNMSPLEVEAARKEIEDRLGPEKVAFLRKRAAQRAQQAAQNTKPHQDLPMATRGVTPNLKATASQGTWTPPVQDPAEVPQTTGAEAEVERKPVSRIRFSLSGEPVGWKSAEEEEAAPTSVVERDLLRQDEGTLSEGYTVHEMCQLARSSLPAQRAFACRHLAALLERARPLMADAYAALFGNKRIPKVLHVPGCDQVLSLVWEDVWEHALKDCQVAVVLRVALDDNIQSVITAAAEALTQLVGLEDLGPALSCPTPSGPAMVPLRYLERPHVLSAWSALPVDIPKPPEMPSMPQNAAEEELDQQLDERQLAAKDPLAGLLQMQVLARISYLLQAGVGMAATDSLLKILQATALGGNDMVGAMCNSPGLVKALLAILDDPPPGGSGQSPGHALHPVRPQVLALLRMLCQAGADVARCLLGQGLKAQVTRFVLGSRTATAPAASPALSMQIEALRIWRICTCFGLTVMSLDDAYPVLWPQLGTPDWVSLSDSGLDAPSTYLHLMATAETLMTVAELLLHAGRAPDQAHVSPQCAAAVLQEAAAWLRYQLLQELFKFADSVSGNDSGYPTIQAALLALAAVLGIVRACTLLPSMVGSQSDASFEAAAMRVYDISEHMEHLGNCLLDSEPPNLALGRAGVAVAMCEVFIGCIRTRDVSSFVATNAVEQLTAILSLQRITPELVTMQPSATGAFQVQQAFLNLALIGIEHVLHGPGGFPDALSWAKVVDAALRVPVLAPPGGEDLALRAMSCALHGMCRWCIRADDLLDENSKGASSFAVAAGMLGAWWQEGDSDVRTNPLPKLPWGSEVRDELLPAYTAHWLGLIPEGRPPSATARGPRAPGGPPTADMAPPPKQSLIRQTVGSRLPTPRDWMFGIEPVPAEVRPIAGLDTIAEEGESVCTPQAERPGRARVTGLGLFFLLALEAYRALPCMTELPLGLKLRGVMDLVFSPATPSSNNGEGDASEALWLDPLIRWTTAALLDIYACKMPTDRLVDSITEADAARWAAHFAAVSYGDALFASALALLLHPNMPGPVQATVLEVLAEEGALHLLPTLHRAPGSAAAYYGPERPKEVTGLLGKLLEEGSLQKAKLSNSMVYDLAEYADILSSISRRAACRAL
ncbi:probable RNA polymerase II-associated protein 1 at N-terminal half [Coccomyxa sp. Obi]|nr:probable RNA polymerase II-associated protein 1 at N-terminal half [Coccomyxa sp. Obi]